MFQGRDIILDDEKYFSLRDKSHKYYYSSDPSEAPNDVKHIDCAKYTPKGLSEIYVHKGKNAVDSDTYINKCMPKLLSFMEEHYKEDAYCFWPDKASCHYSDKTKAFYEENGIDVVPRDMRTLQIYLKLDPSRIFGLFLIAKCGHVITSQNPSSLSSGE